MATENGAEGNTAFDKLLNDPDGLPTDASELAAAFENATIEGESDASGTQPGDEKTPPAGDDPSKAAAPQGEEAAGKKPTGEQSGATPSPDDSKGDVLAKDGKHVIPYAVLESARKRAEESDRIAEEARQRAAEVEAELKRRDAGGDAAADPAKGGERQADEELIESLKQSNAALESLAADSPALAEVFAPQIKIQQALIERMGKLQGRLDEFDQRAQNEEAARVSDTAKTVQEAIDGNPVLRYWQNEDQEAWNRAARFDQRMRGVNEKGERVSEPDPDYMDMPLDKRLEHVVQIMESRHGKVELPEAYQPKQPAGSGEPKPDQSGDIKARAEAKIKEAAKGGQKPLTLSDLPGGAPPSSGDKRLDEMSLGEVESRLNKMLDQGMSIQEIVAQYG